MNNQAVVFGEVLFKSWEKKPPIGVVRVDEKPHLSWIIDDRDDDWLAVAKVYFPHHKERRKADKAEDRIKWTVVRVPWKCIEPGISTTRVTPSFSPCTYDATDKFTSKWLGIGLDYDDKEWLARHPFAESGGLSMAHTPTCIHQLVEPYGLGIWRIRLPIGSLVEHVELQRWVKALGINPFALTDGRTTNAAAAQRLGLTLEEADERWRFEYGEEPIRPAIIGNKTGANVFSGMGYSTSGGHAEYIGPRGRAKSDWTIAIQLARSVTYHTKLELPDYEQKALEENMSLSLAGIRKPDGSKLVEMEGGRYIDAKDKKPVEVKTYDPAPWYDRGGAGAGAGATPTGVMSDFNPRQQDVPDGEPEWQLGRM